MAEEKDIKTHGIIPCFQSTRLLAWQEDVAMPGGYVSVANVVETAYGQYATNQGVQEAIASALSSEYLPSEQDIIALIQQYAGQGGGSVPLGTIVFTLDETAPTDWYILDGSPVSELLAIGVYLLSKGQASNGDGTVNLWDFSERVILQAGNGIEVGDFGGENAHVIVTSETPSHIHYYYTSQYTGGAMAFWGGNPAAYAWPTTPVGGGLPHNNMQEYVAGNFIIYGGE